MNEDHKLKKEVRRFKWAFFTVLMVGIFAFWFYALDGVYTDKLITYPDYFNPSEVETTMEIYEPGDEVNIKLAFCKNRKATEIDSQWNLVNGDLKPLIHDLSERGSRFSGRELPVRCYPGDQSQENYTIYTAGTIPPDALPGIHRIVGVITRELPGGRLIKEEIQTQEIYIENPLFAQFFFSYQL